MPYHSDHSFLFDSELLAILVHVMKHEQPYFHHQTLPKYIQPENINVMKIIFALMPSIIANAMNELQ